LAGGCPASPARLRQSWPDELTNPADNAGISTIQHDLDAECDRIEKLIVAAEKQDVLARYEIAIGCEKIRKGDGKGRKYGEGAVEALAKSIGWRTDKVYRYAAVARTWPNRKGLEDLLALGSDYGTSLTWSHILLLVRVDDGKEQMKLADETLKNGWSVRELKAAVKKKPAQPAGNSPPTPVTPPPDAAPSEAKPEPERPSEMTRAIERLRSEVGSWKDNSAAWAKELPKAITNAQPEDLDEGLKQLRQASRDLDAGYQSYKKKLDTCILQMEERCKLEVRKRQVGRQPQAAPQRPTDKRREPPAHAAA